MDTIDRIRAFNRFYTHRLGLLDRSYLQSGFTLTEVRVLYELAAGELRTARAMARALGLDEGYLSRLLKRFAGKGWVERHPNPEDGREMLLSLTEAGRAAYAPLAARSRADVGAMLSGLDAAGQEVLCAAMEQAMDLLGDAPRETGEVVLRDLRPGDAGWIIGQHGELYARDEGYDATFEALVAEILAGFLRDHDPECERGWIAERDGQRLGSIFVVRADAETAKLRLVLLRPEARGTGLGRRMLDTAMGWARARGYKRMVLWTHASHEAACALYRKAGFVMTSETPAHDFGQDVLDQTWEIAL
ncbi:GNAT family N-acetyltransferase [Acidimangrovimonas pyrenivorans]|uniref:GNAT family N-acetyltransferase n=1 Tax=Acidimangrovimonas pyrenivorans TaxID=2030798 RepID=A0ABV7AGW2_9RHOB